MRADTIIWVGSERGLEVTLVPPTGHPLHVLPGRGLQRRLTLANVGALWGLFVAAARAFGLVRRLRPRVVVVLGGYASVPCAFAAWACRVPIVVMEQNKRPGLANRLSARVAKAVAVSFEGTPLPHAVVTGNPLRKEVMDVDRARRSAPRRPHGRPCSSLVARWARRASTTRRSSSSGCGRTRADLAVRHVVGPRNIDSVRARAPSLPTGGLQYEIVAYEDDMPTAMAAADVVVCRASSGLVSEVAVIGVPSVLVPWSGAAEDHQTANASVLLDVGAAEVITDAELTRRASAVGARVVARRPGSARLHGARVQGGGAAGRRAARR